MNKKRKCDWERGVRKKMRTRIRERKRKGERIIKRKK